MRRRLVRRWGKWAGLAATLLLVAVTVASAWGRVGSCAAPRGWVWVGAGRVDIFVKELASPAVISKVLWQGPGPVEPNRASSFTWRFERWTFQGIGRNWVVPLWWLCLGAGVPTLILWWRDWHDRRRAAEGCCRRCGYDLGGLAAGAPCPECGQTRPC